MGKPKKSLFEQQSKKSKRKPQVSKMNSQDDEEVDDVMAWGRKRQNYYRQDEDEYSSQSEELKQAEQIYKNKYDNYLNDEDVYDVPEEKQDEADKKAAQLQLDQNLDEQETLPEEYVKQQLEWVLELFKDLQFYEENNLFQIYQKLLKSYLTVIISIKELKIPYIQYHPIIPMAVEIKSKITKLIKKLTIKEEDQVFQEGQKVNKKKQGLLEEESDQQAQDEEIDEDQMNGSQVINGQGDDFDEIEWNESEENLPQKNKKSKLKSYPDHCTQASKAQSSEHKKGLEFYNSMKAANEEQKKKKKQQKRQDRKTNKKPAFKQLGQNEGRFASELILKNKGLIKKRKKIEGNSRVKLRKKYQKKKSIHRARSGHFVRENPGRAYQGESNIRTGKIAGVRLK